MAVTIKDVAKRAGVAASTVSRTLKDNPNISEATKEKVRKAMKELGYVPNVAAQNLATKYTKNIGLVLPPSLNEQRIQHPFFMDAISEISQCLNEKEYTASIAFDRTIEGLLDNVKMMYQQRRVDGFIILYSLEDDPVSSFLLENNVPFVMLGAPENNDNAIRYVDNDNVSVGRTATRYLIDKGHQEIMFVGRTPKEMVYQERYNGYLLEMQRSNYQVRPFYNIEDNQSIASFMEALEEKALTAIVASDDVLAVKLIPFLKQYGYHVGENFSVISVNNSVFSTLYHPYLTTVDIHLSSLARQSAQLIIDVLKENDLPLTKYIIPHDIVVRETVIPNQ